MKKTLRDDRGLNTVKTMIAKLSKGKTFKAMKEIVYREHFKRK